MGILHAAMENGPFIHGLIGFTKIYLWIMVVFDDFLVYSY